MSKIEHNRIYYDPYNEIICDKFALEKLVKEREEKDKTIADLETKLEKADQDKISFCIEKLEKVKDYAQHIQGGLINYIDNQIKELKTDKNV